MMKIELTKEQVWGIVKNCCKAAFGAMVIAGAYWSRDTTTSSTQKTDKPVVASYSQAVSTIVNSSMWDYYKTSAIELLKRDGDASYYAAVISTVESDMYDHKKMDIIKTLSKK